MRHTKLILLMVVILLSIGKWMMDKQKALKSKQVVIAKKAPEKKKATSPKIKEDEVDTEDIDEEEEYEDVVEEPEDVTTDVVEDTNSGNIAKNDPSPPPVPVFVPQEQSKKTEVRNPQTALRAACPGIKLFKEEDIEDEVEFGSNTHFVKDGETYRVRVFIEDSANRSYKKLVLYKEDSEGFPVVVPTPEDKSIDPSDEYIDSFYAGRQVLHESADVRIKLRDGRTISITDENGEYVKFNSKSDNCFYEK